MLIIMNKTSKVNLKSIPKDTQEYIRGRVVVMHQAGELPEDIARYFGVSIRSVYHWVSQYAQHGDAALKTKPHPGPPSKISDDQLQELAEILRDKNTAQFDLDFALWTLPRIQLVIKERFGISFSVPWTGTLVRRLGFSPQRPKVVATQQDPEKVARWMEHTLPTLLSRAKEEGAQVWFGDEAAFRTTEAKPRTWGMIGETPVIYESAARGSVNAISAVSANGEFLYSTTEKRVNSVVFGGFLEELVHGRDYKNYLVLDNSSIHKAKYIEKLIEENGWKLELVLLPSYSPDLNPVELAWAYAKLQVRATVHRSADAFKKVVRLTMEGMTKQTALISSLVRHCAPQLAC